MPWRESIRSSILDALAILLPVDCAGCGEPDRSLCTACRAELVPEPSIRAIEGMSVITALRYDGTVRRVILNFKEHDRTDVGATLAVPLATAIRAAIAAHPTPTPVELALVPTSRAAYRRRGYDPVALLVRRAGYRHPKVLRHVRSTARQKSLDVAGRHDNLVGAMAARSPLHGRAFIVVDDIVTTGSTLLEAARAIRAAGGEVVGAAALAFTPRLLSFRDILGSEDYGEGKGAQ